MQTASFTAIVDKFPNKMGLHYVFVPEEIAIQFEGKHPIRIRALVDGETMQCALMKRADEKVYFIYLNAMLRKKKKIRVGDTITVSLMPDDSEFGLDMPEELEELLAQDDEGREKFLRLKPGTQRNIIYYISSGALVDTRINRSIMMINRVKSNYWPLTKAGK